jgi:hypothetical protein
MPARGAYSPMLRIYLRRARSAVAVGGQCHSRYPIVEPPVGSAVGDVVTVALAATRIVIQSPCHPSLCANNNRLVGLALVSHGRAIDNA